MQRIVGRRRDDRAHLVHPILPALVDVELGIDASQHLGVRMLARPQRVGHLVVQERRQPHARERAGDRLARRLLPPRARLEVLEHRVLVVDADQPEREQHAVQPPAEDGAGVAERAVAGDDRLAADGDVDHVVVADAAHRERHGVVLDHDAEHEVVGIERWRLGADVERRLGDRVEHPLEVVLVGEPRHGDADDAISDSAVLAGPARPLPADVEPADQDGREDGRSGRRPLAAQRPRPRHERRALRLERPEQIDRHADQGDGGRQHEEQADPGETRHGASVSSARRAGHPRHLPLGAASPGVPERLLPDVRGSRGWRILHRTFDVLHVFFIPFLPLGFWKRWLCAMCGAESARAARDGPSRSSGPASSC